MHEQDKLEQRLQTLHELKGRDLVNALIREIGDLQRQLSQLQREMAAYRDYQAARDRWLVIDTVQKARVQLPKSVTIDASHALHPRQGFYGLEYGARGTPFSWTGPTPNFSFDIYIDRSQGADLELRALSCMNFERQKDLRLLVNGETVPTATVKNGNGLVLKADLPARDDDRSCNIVFCVPEVLRPADSNDKRLLGIAFHSLSVMSRAEAGATEKIARPDDTVVTLSRNANVKRADEVQEPVKKVAASDAAAS